MNSAKVPIIHMDMYVRPQDDPSMLKRTKAAFLVALILIPFGARAQNQASVAVFLKEVFKAFFNEKPPNCWELFRKNSNKYRFGHEVIIF